MALVSLLPKRFRPSDDRTTPASTEPPVSPQPSQPVGSSSSTSLKDNVSLSEVQLAEPGRDATGKFKLPPIALYVSGAAFTLTIGLTAMVYPHIRAMQRSAARRPATFIAHRHVETPYLSGRQQGARKEESIASSSSPSQLSQSDTITTPSVSSSSATSADASAETKGEKSKPARPVEWIDIAASQSQPVLSPDASEALARSRRFNSKEEKTLYGSSTADSPESGTAGGFDEDAASGGLLGVKALGIATLIVGTSAGLGAFIVAKLMGVESMSEFAAKMRGSMNRNFPGMVQSITEARQRDLTEEPLLTSIIDGTADDAGVESWVQGLLSGESNEQGK